MNHGLFRGKYRSPSHRRRGSDYADIGWYFVTICTQNKIPWFGEIRQGIMGLNDAGCVVADYWEQIPNHFAHIELGPFVVMPDHIHGIIGIVEVPERSQRNIWLPVDTCDSHVSTNINIFRQMVNYAMGSVCRSTIPRPRPGSVGSIIGQFKSACTKRIRQINPEFKWLNNYHDRIIRNEREYYQKCRYIRQNPKRLSTNL